MKEEEKVLHIGTQEQELLVQEVSSLIQLVHQTEQRIRYEALQKALLEGQVPLDLQETLASILEMGLESGRIRRVYRAEGERLLTELYRRTPRGKQLQQCLHQVNQALAVLKDRKITSLRFDMRTFGTYTLRIESDECEVTLVIRREGVEVESLTVPF